MLSCYPEVASAGDLATALSRTFAAEGSSLTAYSPVPPRKPTWSIFSDHPKAPGKTVPEFARVKADQRACQLYIGWFEVPLGTYHVEFFDSSERDEIADLDCWIDAKDLRTAGRIIRGAFERDAEVSELAAEHGAMFGRRPRSREEEADRALRKMPAEDRERELARRRARAYEIIGLSEDRVREILLELQLEELTQCWERAMLDLREHVRNRHPEEGLPWSGARMLRNVIRKLNQTSADPERGFGADVTGQIHELLVDTVVRSVSAYWSHVTEGHAPPKGSAEEYLISLTEKRRARRWRRSKG